VDTVEFNKDLGAFFRGKVAPLFSMYGDRLRTEVIKKEEGELVGTLDLEVQRRFLDFWSRYLTDYPVVSEEADNWPPGFPPPLTNWWEADRYCVLDPFDGTHNYLMGFQPATTVMLTLVEAKRPIFSAIFNPTSSSYFTADLSMGVALENRSGMGPIELGVSPEADLGDTMGLVEGSTAGVAKSDLAQLYMRSVKRWRSTLGFGTSATLLASGGNHPAGASALVSIGNKIVDNIHGVLFTELADGVVTKSDGELWLLDSPDRPDLVFSNGAVHDQILELADIANN